MPKVKDKRISQKEIQGIRGGAEKRLVLHRSGEKLKLHLPFVKGKDLRGHEKDKWVLKRIVWEFSVCIETSVHIFKTYSACMYGFL